MEIVEFEVGLEFSVDDGVFLKDARLVFEFEGSGHHKVVDASFSHLKTLDRSVSAQNDVSSSRYLLLPSIRKVYGPHFSM